METKEFDEIRDRNYDAIIIGAGIGGLTAGCFLAQKGKKVLIVEQMKYPGGCICSFRHKGYYFDAGPTSVSFLKILSKIYGDLDIWKDIDLVKVHHQLIAPGLNIDIKDKKALIDGLANKYPESRNDLERLFKHMEKIVNNISPIYDHHPSYKEGAARRLAQITMPITMFKTVYTASKYTKISKKQTIEKYLKKENQVKDIFMATGYENIATVDMSFMWETFSGDLYYPKGGMTSLIKPLSNYIENHGGDILYQHKVESILVDEKAVVGIKLSGNRVIKAAFYISNADYKKTFLQLIGKNKLSDKLVNKLNNAGVTEPILNLFLGLRVSISDLPIIKRPNSMLFLDDGVPHYMLDQNDPDFYKKVHLSAYIPNFNDSSLNEPGKTSMVLASVGNYHFREKWKTKDGERGEEYRKLKQEISDILIDRLEKIIPNIREYIEYSSLATPITYERYTGTWEGASCGWAGEKSKAFFKNDIEAAMGNFTPFSNLFMAGQWTYFNGGIPSALQSGRTVGVDVSRMIDKKEKKHNQTIQKMIRKAEN